jgi:hypothetical protein
MSEDGPALTEDIVLVCKGVLPPTETLSLADAIGLVTSRTGSIETFIFCLEGLHHFHHQEVREYAFGKLSYFVCSLWTSIPPSTYELLIAGFVQKNFTDANYACPSFLLQR